MTKHIGVDRRIIVIAWAIGIGFALFLLANDIITYQQSRGLSINGSAIWGRDFVNVWSGGRLVLDGKLALIYDIDAYRAWQSASFGWGLNDHNYSYPPLTLLYAPLFGAVPYLVALALWLVGSAALFCWAARSWLAEARLSPWVALALPATLICLWAGHYGLLIGALWLAAWAQIDRRPRLAGVLIGLMAVKPHLAILLPLVLARRGDWTTIAVAALTVGILVGLSCLAFGAEPWRTYVAQTSADQMRMVAATHTFFIKMMPTVTPALFAYGFGPAAAGVTQTVVGLAAAIALVVRLPAGTADAGLATAVATFLVVPYAFNYDLTVVGLAALIAMHRAVSAGARWHLLAAGAAFVLPAILIFINKAGFWLGPLILAAFLATLLRPAETARMT